MSPSDWASDHKTAEWLFAGASMREHWDRNQSVMITEEEYSAAIKLAANVGVK